MESKLTFEVGKHYRTRDGKKATVYLIRPTYMVGEIEGRTDNPYTWNRCGEWKTGFPYSCDLVAEYREPARQTICMYRHRQTGEIWTIDRRVNAQPGPWELIGAAEIVEGEGL